MERNTLIENVEILYQSFKATNSTEPTCAKILSCFRGEYRPEEVLISLSPTCEENDEDLFFECTDYSDFKDLCRFDSHEDFVILQIIELF